MPGRLLETTITLTSDFCDPARRVSWLVGPLSFPNGGCVLRTSLAEGSYPVVARVPSLGVRYERTIVVQDFVIASVGDSNGSGEGNRSGGAWANADCDRSHLAGSAQAAHAIERGRSTAEEREARRASVTFVHLACSGGRIDRGLLRPYEGMNEDDDVVQPPQLPSLWRVLNGSELDALIVSVGINNMGPDGFGALIIQCLDPLFGDCSDLADDASAASQFASLIVPSNPLGLPAQYARLRACLAAPATCGDLSGTTVTPSRVYVTEYPDLASGDDGAFCSVVNPVNPGLDLMSQAEFEWTRTGGDQLNATIRRLAGGAGYRYVSGIASAFRDRGYCASSARRLIVRIEESLLRQGDPNGAFHPNEAGHRVTRDALLGPMRLDLFPDGLPRPPAGGAPASKDTAILPDPPPATTNTAARTSPSTPGSSSTTTATRPSVGAPGVTSTTRPAPGGTSGTTTVPGVTTRPGGATSTTVPGTVVPPGAVSSGEGMRGCAQDLTGALRLAATCRDDETPVRWSVPVGATGPTPPPLDGRAMSVCIGDDAVVRVLEGGSPTTRSCNGGERLVRWALRGPAPGQPSSPDLAVLCAGPERVRLAVERTAEPPSAGACRAGEQLVTFHVDGPPPGAMS